MADGKPERTDWAMRVVTRVARAVPHPDPPTPRYLRYRRGEVLPPRLVRPLLGPVRRDVELSELTVTARDGARLPVRLYRPRHRTAKLPLVVAFHGGGFVFGSFVENDWLCTQVAGRVDAVVASVGYRLAPEHPAPGPGEDCWDATRWLWERATALGADRTRMSVLGSSAGGNLAALVALAHRDLVRDRPQIAPLTHQVLVYPATDLTLSSPSIALADDDAFLSREALEWFGRQYVPQDRPDRVALDDARVSPLHASDHTDLAPALILVGGRDPLRDDGTRYADVLRAAGVPVRVELHPDAVHGFMSLPRLLSAARVGADQVVEFLRT
ncbi:MAG: alpha/beta hydrolase [Propionibacteriaceae bacterium]